MCGYLFEINQLEGRVSDGFKRVVLTGPRDEDEQVSCVFSERSAPT